MTVTLATHASGDQAAQADRATRENYARHQREIAERTDRLFFWILLADWLALILIVLRRPPPSGCRVETVPAWSAFLVGALVAAWPMYAARTQPGDPANRRQTSIAHAFMVCLVVHFSRGRSEVHLAAIVSVGLVASYRSTRTLLLTSAIVAADHILGNFFWVEALYGQPDVGAWAWLRHVGRLAVEDVLLVLAINRSRQDLRRLARRTALMDSHRAVLERVVAERQRTEGLLSAQYALTRLLASSTTLRDAASEILRIVGEYNGWDLGELWEVDEREQFIRCVDVWHGAGVPIPASLQVRRGVELRPEEGLPGRVWNRHLPLWIADITAEGDPPLIVIADGEQPMRAAFAVPLRNGPDVIGVMAFYSRVERASEDDQLSTIGGLGGQLGQFMDRKRVELGLRLAHAELESSVEKRTRQLVEINGKLQAEVQERERVQRELIAAKELADAASQAKSAFLASMSHELRTPLNAVIGFSELLEQEIFGTLAPKQRSYVNNVLLSGRHLLQLVNDILDISKVEAGRMDLVCEWTHLGGVVDVVRSVIQAQAAKKGINLEVSISDKLPELYIDPGRIKQVLYNLVSNGIKFTPRGGSVRLTAYFEDERVCVEVADTGVGIAPENLPRLFHEFEQIPQARGERPEGTGLGLALTKRLVGLHGGEVSVESRVGHGSIFSVWLPWRARDAAAVSAPAAPGKTNSTKLDARASDPPAPAGTGDPRT